MIETILLAIGLVLIVEGLVYALAPSFIEQILDMFRSLSLEQRRLIGLLCIVLGAMFLWCANLLGT